MTQSLVILYPCGRFGRSPWLLASLAVSATWAVNQQTEDLSPPLSLLLSVMFPIKINILNNKKDTNKFAQNIYKKCLGLGLPAVFLYVSCFTLIIELFPDLLIIALFSIKIICNESLLIALTLSYHPQRQHCKFLVFLSFQRLMAKKYFISFFLLMLCFKYNSYQFVRRFVLYGYTVFFTVH